MPHFTWAGELGSQEISLLLLQYPVIILSSYLIPPYPGGTFYRLAVLRNSTSKKPTSCCNSCAWTTAQLCQREPLHFLHTCRNPSSPHHVWTAPDQGHLPLFNYGIARTTGHTSESSLCLCPHGDHRPPWEEGWEISTSYTEPLPGDGIKPTMRVDGVLGSLTGLSLGSPGRLCVLYPGLERITWMLVSQLSSFGQGGA